MTENRCECCGHPKEGTCPRCLRQHHPAVETGCEACIRHYDVPPAYTDRELQELCDELVPAGLV